MKEAIRNMMLLIGAVIAYIIGSFSYYKVVQIIANETLDIFIFGIPFAGPYLFIFFIAIIVPLCLLITFIIKRYVKSLTLKTIFILFGTSLISFIPPLIFLGVADESLFIWTLSLFLPAGFIYGLFCGLFVKIDKHNSLNKVIA